MVVFGVLFGWRESTLVSLERADVFLSDTMLSFSESFCKRFQTAANNPYRTLCYDCTAFPGLYWLFQWYLGERDALASTSLLWDCGSPTPSLMEALTAVLTAIHSD